MRSIGLLDTPKLDEHRRQLIDDKRAEFEAREPAPRPDESSSFPAVATLCAKCSTKAVVQLDGCMTCLNCGDSKCG
jgi:hypothetical protein